MKIFNTRSKETGNYCMEMFNVQTPHCTITKRKCRFISNIMSSKNVLYANSVESLPKRNWNCVRIRLTEVSMLNVA